MAVVNNIDVFAGASHSNMLAHLAGPFSGGAIEGRLEISAAGRVRADSFREALVIVAPVLPVENAILRVRAVLNPGPQQIDLTPALEFLPYTEAEAFLPLHR